jgi:hypothetical protein
MSQDEADGCRLVNVMIGFICPIYASFTTAAPHSVGC